MRSKLYLLAAIIIAICGIHHSAIAQTTVTGWTWDGTPRCGIYYSYDEAGNRVKREYKCVIPPNPLTEPVTNATIRNVYPNPTTGIINVEFSNPTATATFFISDMNGAQILQYNVTQLTTIVTFDITPQVPSTYLLTVITTDDVESYPITKL